MRYKEITLFKIYQTLRVCVHFQKQAGCKVQIICLFVNMKYK